MIFNFLMKILIYGIARRTMEMRRNVDLNHEAYMMENQEFDENRYNLRPSLTQV